MSKASSPSSLFARSQLKIKRQGGRNAAIRGLRYLGLPRAFVLKT